MTDKEKSEIIAQALYYSDGNVKHANDGTCVLNLNLRKIRDDIKDNRESVLESVYMNAFNQATLGLARGVKEGWTDGVVSFKNLNETINFKIICEFKKYALSETGFRKALSQLIYYYIVGLDIYKENDSVRYLIVGDPTYFRVYDIKYMSEILKECIYWVQPMIHDENIKISGSNIWDNCAMLRQFVSSVPRYAITQYRLSGDKLQDAIIDMINNSLNK